MSTKLDFLIKCLNFILLKKSDPFLAAKYKAYLRAKQREKNEIK
jgi:hypothetical protein